MKIKLSEGMKVTLIFIDAHGWRRGICRSYTTKALAARGLIAAAGEGDWAITRLGHLVAMYVEQEDECESLLWLCREAAEAHDERGMAVFTQTRIDALGLLSDIERQIEETP